MGKQEVVSQLIGGDVSMHNRFALVSLNVPTGFVFSNEKSAGFSFANLLQTDLGYQLRMIKIYTSPFLFGFQTWAMIRIYFVTSSISLLFF